MHVRSGSQKTLLVISIIDIVSGALALIAGLMTTLLGGFMGAAVGGAGEELAEAGVTAAEAGAASAVTSILSVFIIVAGIISIIEGILGVRAANDATKIMPVWIIAIVSLVGSIVSLIMVFVNGSFADSGLSTIATLVIDAMMFWIANNIKVEAGR